MSNNQYEISKKLLNISNMLLGLGSTERSAKPSYVGVWLTPESRYQLLTKVTPGHLDLHAEHVTIAHSADFNVKGSWSSKLEEIAPVLKTSVDIRVVGVANDSDCQAVLVELPDFLSSLNPSKKFHITISTAPGVKPKYSNELLRVSEVDRSNPPFPFILKGVVDTYPRA